MLEFVVEAPFDLPLYKRNLVRDKLNASPPKEWLRLRGFTGCYIFVAPRKRVPSELIPIYVGKAAHSFEQECFTADKLTKINRFLLDYRSERLSLILIRHPNRRGHVNERAIDELEKYLIRMAVSVNHALINKQGTKPEKWGIRGIIRGGRGHVSQSANTLRAILGMQVDDAKAVSVTSDALENAAALPVAEGAESSIAGATLPAHTEFTDEELAKFDNDATGDEVADAPGSSGEVECFEVMAECKTKPENVGSGDKSFIARYAAYLKKHSCWRAT